MGGETIYSIPHAVCYKVAQGGQLASRHKQSKVPLKPTLVVCFIAYLFSSLPAWQMHRQVTGHACASCTWLQTANTAVDLYLQPYIHTPPPLPIGSGPPPAGGRHAAGGHGSGATSATAPALSTAPRAAQQRGPGRLPAPQPRWARHQALAPLPVGLPQGGLPPAGAVSWPEGFLSMRISNSGIAGAVCWLSGSRFQGDLCNWVLPCHWKMRRLQGRHASCE